MMQGRNFYNIYLLFIIDKVYFIYYIFIICISYYPNAIIDHLVFFATDS